MPAIPLYSPPDSVSQGLAEAPLPNPGGSQAQLPADPTGGILAGGAISGVGSLITSGLNMYAAAQNRKWMEHMSNTAHQREVADLRAAGLNPLLSAARFGGASTPTSSAPQVNSGLDSVGAGISSAAQAKMNRAMLMNQAQNSAYQGAILQQQAHGQYLDNMSKQQELLRTGMINQQLQKDLKITDEQILQIEAQKAKGEQMKEVYKWLGPAGTFIIDQLLPAILGHGNITGPWSAASSRRSRIRDSGGNYHNDATGAWQSPYPGGKDTP